MTSNAKEFELIEGTFVLETDGHKVPVFEVGPKDIACPALIMVHEIFGLNDHIRDVARRYAKASGLRVFAPDLFEGHEGVPADKDNLDAMRAHWSKIPDAELIGDLQKLFSVISARDDVLNDSIGTIGYCMGGAIALMFACVTPYLIYVIDFYGRVQYPELTEAKPKNPIDYAGGNVCPVLGVFSGIDPLIPSGDVELFKTTLKRYSPDVQVKIYPDAPHAFFNDRRENYRADAAKDAWELTLNFIDRQIKVQNA